MKAKKQKVINVVKSYSGGKDGWEEIDSRLSEGWNIIEKLDDRRYLLELDLGEIGSPLKHYEVGKPSIFFECDWAVYKKGGLEPVCYTTSEQRAEFVATAIERFMDTAEGKTYLGE